MFDFSYSFYLILLVVICYLIMVSYLAYTEKFEAFFKKIRNMNKRIEFLLEKS